ncbi:hypothetical protein [uncultured Croceitalea sp.]|uniref:hypothetical protein n=1 Tax=uncultured Croceitalea sp. TaxID=1798908 RepID=UPI00330599F7
MKSFIILFISFTMLVRPLWPIAEYIMNYDYIVNVLCENKDKPQLQCDGKCYLAKQLAVESGESEENPFGTNNTNIEVLPVVFFERMATYNFVTANLGKKLPILKTITDLVATLFVTDISQPPELS